MQMPGKQKDEDGSMTGTHEQIKEGTEDESLDATIEETGEWSIVDTSEGFDPYNSGAHRLPKKK